MMKNTLLFFILIFNIPPLTLQAAKPDSLFFEANELYRTEQYYEAIEAYQRILTDGYEHADLYYNLANAYYKVKEYPKAILFYEKALKLNPRFDDARFNLQLTKETILPQMQELPEPFYVQLFHNIMNLLTARQWAIASILFAFLTALFVALFLIAKLQRPKSLLFYASILSLFLLFLTLTSGYFRWQNTLKSEFAIIMKTSASIKSSPDEHSTDLYIAPAGMKVKILSTLSDWYEIKLPDGSKGWVHESAIEII